MSDIEKQTDTRWALSPVSGRYVLRTSTTYKRLVKGGFVHDPEVADQLARPATGTKPKYKGPNVVLRAETDQLRDVVAAAVAAEMAKLGLNTGAARKKPPRRALPVPAQASESDEDVYTETSVAGTEAEPPTEPEEPERPIRVVRHIVGRRR